MSTSNLHRCGDCRHWKPLHIGDAYEPDFHQVFHAEVGTCGMITHAGMDTEWVADKLVTDGVVAATTDAEDYSSALLTQRGFGCTLFEQKT